MHICHAAVCAPPDLLLILPTLTLWLLVGKLLISVFGAQLRIWTRRKCMSKTRPGEWLRAPEKRPLVKVGQEL